MPMTNNKFLSLVGLCQKAKKLVSGEFSCINAIRSKNAKLIIVACNASENTKKKFANAADFYKIDIIYICNKEDLGNIIGKDIRSSIVITDEGFAKRLKELSNTD